MRITELQNKLDALKAAAAGKPRTSTEFLAAVEAVKELAAAKKAAQPSAEQVAQEQASLLAAAKAAQARRTAQKAAQAAEVYVQNQFDWPRCGQDFGEWIADERAIAVIRGAGGTVCLKTGDVVYGSGEK